MPAVAVAPSELPGAQREQALDDVIVHAWEELTAGRGCACPVCGGEMKPEYGGQARALDGAGKASRGEAGCRAGRTPAGGRCKSCGARLH